MDDNEDTGEMYATGLSYAGFAPVVARTALEGLQLAGETSPDVIITDVMLPGPIDGHSID